MPFDIQIQELHGTGTALGDPIEVGALRATMMMHKGATRNHPLVKTSSKSNIGHTESTAGITGIMKCVIMSCYAVGPANVHLRMLNPHIDANGYPVHFNSEIVDQGFQLWNTQHRTSLLVRDVCGVTFWYCAVSDLGCKLLGAWSLALDSEGGVVCVFLFYFFVFSAFCFLTAQSHHKLFIAH